MALNWGNQAGRGKAARNAENKDMVRKMNGAFQKQARKDKEAYLNEQCKEMVEVEKMEKLDKS